MLHHKTFVLGPGHDWVVFVHGAGGSSSIWYKQLREFRRHFNVLLVDLRGHGGSQDGPERAGTGDYTFEEISREIIEVLDHAAIASAHFVGISLGTIVIRTLGEIAPERVRSLVMGGAVTRLNLRSRVLVALGNLGKRLVPYMWLYRLFAWVIMPRKRHESSRLLFVGEAKKLCQKEFIRWFRLTYEVNPLLRFFEEKEIPVPTLYLMGDEDYMFLPPVRHIVARHARWSQLRVIANSGHVCNVDQAERFNLLSILFIQGHPLPAAA
ncbi:MAG TPA: alpha/beta hydrolase [Longimicrobiaceae bacterium]|jgi:pimeloyl-ACP methyl ester carboxylesterase|nr:alpha/beta hydrolase [Longimicrobiaceae bacterium]